MFESITKIKSFLNQKQQKVSNPIISKLYNNRLTNIQHRLILLLQVH